MRTHLTIAVALVLIFLPYVNYKWVFVPVLLIAAMIPDIDSGGSKIGHKLYLRPLQWFIKHRGLIHSFTFCIFVSILLALIIPILAFPFFLGYASHLFSDSFTLEGIQPFWPARIISNGLVRTGGKMEYSVFVVFVLIDILLLIKLFV